MKFDFIDNVVIVGFAAVHIVVAVAAIVLA